MKSGPEIFAHRGYSARAPENTLAAFRMAVEAGAAAIELDVHRCASGEIVVIHDHSLERTTGVRSQVERTDWATIRALDAGSWFDPRFRGERIPLLAEVFDALGDGITFDVETKWTPGGIGPLEEQLVREIERHGMARRAFVSSFHPLSIRRVRLVEPSIETAVLYSGLPSMPFWLRRGQGRLLSGSRILKPHHDLVTERSMRHHTRAGHRVITWTVDDPVEARRLAELGVHGIITNDPLVVSEALAQ